MPTVTGGKIMITNGRREMPCLCETCGGSQVTMPEFYYSHDDKKTLIMATYVSFFCQSCKDQHKTDLLLPARWW